MIDQINNILEKYWSYFFRNGYAMLPNTPTIADTATKVPRIDSDIFCMITYPKNENLNHPCKIDTLFSFNFRQKLRK